jgi:hypothetical protein
MFKGYELICTPLKDNFAALSSLGLMKFTNESNHDVHVDVRPPMRAWVLITPA